MHGRIRLHSSLRICHRNQLRIRPPSFAFNNIVAFKTSASLHTSSPSLNRPSASTSRTRQREPIHSSEDSVPESTASHRSENALDLSSPPPPKNSISKRVVNFFKSESRAAIETLIGSNISTNETQNEERLFQTYNIDPTIKLELERIFEADRKFLALLSYPPHKIHPDVYMHFYQTKVRDTQSNISKNELSLLVKRLIHHRQFEYVWIILERGEMTLTDIEELIETLIYRELSLGQYVDFGMMELIAAAHESISNVSLRNSLIDTLCYKYGLKQEEQLSKLERLREWKEYLREGKGLRSLKAPKSRQNSGCSGHDYELLSEMSKLPGFVSFMNLKVSVSVFSRSKFLSETHDGVVKSNLTLNQTDFDLIFQNTPTGDLHLLYPFFNQLLESGALLENRKKYTDEIFISMIKRKDSKHIKDCITRYHQSIDPELLISALVHVYINSVESWFQLFTEVTTPFSIDHSTYSQFKMGFLESLLKSLRLRTTSSLQLQEEAYQLIQRFHSNNLLQDERVLEKVLSYINNPTKLPPTEFYHKILKVGALSASNIIELSAHASFTYANQSSSSYKDKNKDLLTESQVSADAITRNEISELYSDLFQTFLYVSFNDSIQRIEPEWKNERLKEREFINPKSNMFNDFTWIYNHATISERRNFSINLSKLSKHIASLSTLMISQIINQTEQFIMESPKFNFVTHKNGKNYLLNKFISSVIIQIDNSHGSKEGIRKMRNVVMNLKFQRIVCHELLYKYLVKYDPNTSISIVAEYVNKKAILKNEILRGIMSGIISSPVLTINERIDFFHKFRAHMKRLNYKSSYKAQTTIELINKLIESKELNLINDINELRTLFDMARKMKVKKTMIAYWIRKLELMGADGFEGADKVLNESGRTIFQKHENSDYPEK